MTTELVSSVDAFEALRPEWNDLVDRMDDPSIFYTWEWHWHYYRHFRARAPLCLIVVRDGKRLIGLAPLCHTTRSALGRQVRVLEMIVGSLADYRTWLVDGTRNRWRIVRAMLDALDQPDSTWDVIDMREVPAQDVTLSQIANSLSQRSTMRHGLRVMARTSRIHFGEGYQSKMDMKEIRRICNKRAQLAKDHTLVCTIGDADANALWPEFLRLHQARWPDSPLHSPAGRRLFDDLRAHFGARGELECSTLTLDGVLAAMHVGFRDRRKVYHYMPVIAEEFRHLRVGNVLLLAMVEHYAATHQQFDFLRGDEQYKLWWTDDVALNYRVRIARRSNLAAMADGFLPATREYLRALEFPGYLAGRLRTLLKGNHERVA